MVEVARPGRTPAPSGSTGVAPWCPSMGRSRRASGGQEVQALRTPGTVAQRAQKPGTRPSFATSSRGGNSLHLGVRRRRRRSLADVSAIARTNRATSSGRRDSGSAQYSSTKLVRLMLHAVSPPRRSRSRKLLRLVPDVVHADGRGLPERARELLGERGAIHRRARIRLQRRGDEHGYERRHGPPVTPRASHAAVRARKSIAPLPAASASRARSRTRTNCSTAARRRVARAGVGQERRGEHQDRARCPPSATQVNRYGSPDTGSAARQPAGEPPTPA